jgi:predicted RNase H-like HicB family nuclease
MEKNMYRFLIVIEKADGNYSAYCPDLPGCVATGKTQEEAAQNMHEAVALHIRGMLEDHLPIPPGVTLAEYIAIPA